jgi:hypothetical protein
MVAPSLASLAIHAALGIVIGTVAIGTYIQSGEHQAHRSAPIEVILDFDQPSPRPASERPGTASEDGARSENSRQMPSPEKSPPSPAASPTQAHEQSRAATSVRSPVDRVEGTLDERIAERLAQVNSQLPNQSPKPLPNRESEGPTPDAVDAAIRSRVTGPGSGAQGGEPGPPGGAAPPTTFAGLKASNVLSVVYVVDASGSLISTLPVIRRELERSLRRLSPEQRFAVIFFQRNEALVQPSGRSGSGPGATALLREATKAAVEETVRWTESVRPSGRSSPLAALERALAARPDVVFLLSTDITGLGDFEVGRDELLRQLDALNPLDRSTGRRPTRIQCIQFLDPDPLDTLKKIAEAHSGGSGATAGAAGDGNDVSGYRFLSRDALGLLHHEESTEERR